MVTEAKIYQTCPKCKGEGFTTTQKGMEDPCQMCDGLGGIPIGFVDVTVILEAMPGYKK